MEHLRFFDESSTPNIKEAVYNAATGQIEIPGDRQTPTPTNTAPTFTTGSTTTRTVAENTVANVYRHRNSRHRRKQRHTHLYPRRHRCGIVHVDSTTGQLKLVRHLTTKPELYMTITVSDGSLTDTSYYQHYRYKRSSNDNSRATRSLSSWRFLAPGRDLPRHRHRIFCSQ